MPIKKRIHTPKRPKSLALIRSIAVKKGKQLLETRFKYAMKDDIDLPTLVRLQRGRFGSGYLSTTKRFKEPTKSLRVNKRAIRNAATAISAFCAICQCAQTPAEAKELVLDCEQLECPLWAFRLGTDPFFNNK